MKMISHEEYDALMAFMNEHIINLWNHENTVRAEEEQLNSTQTGFSICDIVKYNVEEGVCFYLIYNSTFLRIINHDLPNTINLYPIKFGTGNANDVIDGLYQMSGFPPYYSAAEYGEFLSNIPCYVVYKRNGEFDNDILRIDLFRHLEPAKNAENNKMEFVGGLLHALKHFSMNGINLSTGKDINDVSDVSHIIYLIAMAFRLKSGEGMKYEAEQPLYSKDYVLQYHFYKEEESGVYFLKTCHLKKNKK
jgi:hypothetical protein